MKCFFFFFWTSYTPPNAHMYQPGGYPANGSTSTAVPPSTCCPSNENASQAENYPRHTVLPPPQQPTVYSRPETRGPAALNINPPPCLEALTVRSQLHYRSMRFNFRSKLKFFECRELNFVFGVVDIEVRH